MPSERQLFHSSSFCFICERLNIFFPVTNILSNIKNRLILKKKSHASENYYAKYSYGVREKNNQ